MAWDMMFPSGIISVFLRRFHPATRQLQSPCCKVYPEFENVWSILGEIAYYNCKLLETLQRYYFNHFENF